MENKGNNFATTVFRGFISYMLRLLFLMISLGPIPKHIAFILDGNRRYAKKLKLGEGNGHRAGCVSLMSMLKYCCELGVEYMTIYAFSIENFKRRPEEVQYVMDLLVEKIDSLLEKESIIYQHGIRMYFVGNLDLLPEPVRVVAEKGMKATSNNSNFTLLICVAYTSTDEIVHAVQESCQEKWDQIKASGASNVRNGEISEEKQEVNHIIKVTDIERHMYMAVAPDPDIIIRTSNETRLSNFLLWQTSNCLLYSPKALWPEIGLRHALWGILNYQRTYPYLEKQRKQL